MKRAWIIAVCAMALVGRSAAASVVFDFEARGSDGALANSFRYVSAEKVGHFSLTGDMLKTSCYFASGNSCLVAYAVFDSGAPGIAMYSAVGPSNPNYGNPGAVDELRYFTFSSSVGGGPFYYPQNGVVYDYGTYVGYDSFHKLTGVLTISESAVPEPASWAMIVGGFGLIGEAMRRRRKVSVALA